MHGNFGHEAVKQIAATGIVGPQHAPSPEAGSDRVRMEAWRAGGPSETDGKYQFGLHNEEIEVQSRRPVEIGRKLAAQEIAFSVDRGRPSHGRLPRCTLSSADQLKIVYGPADAFRPFRVEIEIELEHLPPFDKRR